MLNEVLEILLTILLTVTACLAFFDWRSDQRRQRRVTLKLTAISYHQKQTPKPMDPIELLSPISQFAQVELTPIDANGARVKLDADAIVAEVLAGEGARTHIQVL